AFGFARRADLLRAGALEDGFTLLRPVAIVGVNREQDSAGSNTALVPLRLVFRNAQSDQGSGDAANGAECPDPGEGGDDRTGGQKRSNAGNRDRADASKPSQGSSEDRARTGAGRNAF